MLEVEEFPELDVKINVIMAWHQRTFEECDFFMQLQKWDEELKEIKDYNVETDDFMLELADLFIVASGMRRFNREVSQAMFKYIIKNYKPFFIKLPEFIDKKMEINRSRTWEIKNGVYRHKIKKAFKRVLKGATSERKVCRVGIYQKHTKERCKDFYK